MCDAIDRYHWSAEAESVQKSFASWDRSVRPLVGEAEEAALDWVWDEALQM